MSVSVCQPICLRCLLAPFSMFVYVCLSVCCFCSFVFFCVCLWLVGYVVYFRAHLTINGNRTREPDNPRKSPRIRASENPRTREAENSRIRESERVRESPRESENTRTRESENPRTCERENPRTQESENSSNPRRSGINFSDPAVWALILPVGIDIPQFHR